MASLPYPPWSTAPSTMDRDRERSNAHAHWWSGAKDRILRPWRKRSSERKGGSAVFKLSQPAGKKRGKAGSGKRRQASASMPLFTPVTQEERMRQRLGNPSDGLPLFSSPLNRLVKPLSQPGLHSESLESFSSSSGVRGEPSKGAFDIPQSSKPTRPLLSNVFTVDVDNGDAHPTQESPKVRRKSDHYWRDPISSVTTAGAGAVFNVNPSEDPLDAIVAQPSGDLTDTLTGLSGDLTDTLTGLSYSDLERRSSERRLSSSTVSEQGSSTSGQLHNLEEEEEEEREKEREEEEEKPVCNLERNPSDVSSGSYERSIDRRQRRVSAVRLLPMLRIQEDTYQQQLEYAADRHQQRRSSTPDYVSHYDSTTSKAMNRRSSFPDEVRNPRLPWTPPTHANDLQEVSSMESDSYAAEIFTKLAQFSGEESDPNDIKGFDNFMMY